MQHVSIHRCWSLRKVWYRVTGTEYPISKIPDTVMNTRYSTSIVRVRAWRLCMRESVTISLARIRCWLNIGYSSRYCFFISGIGIQYPAVGIAHRWRHIIHVYVERTHPRSNTRTNAIFEKEAFRSASTPFNYYFYFLAFWQDEHHVVLSTIWIEHPEERCSDLSSLSPIDRIDFSKVLWLLPLHWQLRSLIDNYSSENTS